MSVLYNITNEQVRERVSEWYDTKKTRVNKSDILKLLTFYNLLITQVRVDVTTYKHEEDSLTIYN